MVTPRNQVCLNSSMLGASLPSTFWEPPVLFKVLFLRLEWQVRLQPKAISWSTCYQYFILVSLLTDQTYGLVASHHSLLKFHPRNQCHSKFRQSIATKKVESLEQVKKKRWNNSIFAVIRVSLRIVIGFVFSFSQKACRYKKATVKFRK